MPFAVRRVAVVCTGLACAAAAGARTGLDHVPLDVGEALGAALMTVALMFYVTLIVTLPFFILYKVLCVLAWLAGRIRRARSRR